MIVWKDLVKWSQGMLKGANVLSSKIKIALNFQETFFINWNILGFLKIFYKAENWIPNGVTRLNIVYT